MGFLLGKVRYLRTYLPISVYRLGWSPSSARQQALSREISLPNRPMKHYSRTVRRTIARAGQRKNTLPCLLIL